MKKTEEFDIAIVGGGLVGRCLARALHKSWRIVIVEPQTTPPQDKRTLALSQNTKHFLETLNLWRHMQTHAAAVRRILVSEQGAFGVVRIDSEEEGLDELGWTVPFEKLYEALDAEGDNACARRVTTASEVRSGRNGADVVLNGECHDIRAKLAVVATGDAETLCPQAGFGVVHSEYRQSAVVLTMRTEEDIGTTAYERFTRHGPMAVMPATENCTVVWTQKSDDAQAIATWDEERIIAALHADFGNRLGEISEAKVLATYPLHLSYLRRMVSGNIVAMGNSAHWLHPVAAQGFNLSMRDINTLAAHLNKAIVAGHSSPTIPDLEHWNRERVADARRVIRFTDMLARGFLEQWKFLTPLRSLALFVLDVCSPCRRAIVRRGLGLDVEYLPL